MSQETLGVDPEVCRWYKRPVRGVRVLVLAVALATLPIGGGGAVASAQPGLPPTLSGESFHQDTPTITSIDCKDNVAFTYSATGTASGPYPGRFTITGGVSIGPGFILPVSLTGSFTIDSPVGRVTGTSFSPNVGLQCPQVTCSGEACDPWGASFGTNTLGFSESDTYEATITTPHGTFSDRGLFRAFFRREPSDISLNGFDQNFRSVLDAPEPVRPTRKSQCKKGGWRQFGFRNQGQCIRFVQHGPKNQAAGLRE